MSIKTFLQKLWDAITSIFNEAVHEVRDIALPVTVHVVDELKAITDFDNADIIGSIGGKLGVAIEDALRKYLPKILLELKLVSTVVNAGDDNAILQAALKELSLSSDVAQNAFYHSISAMLLQDLADGQISWSEAVMLVEYYYKNKPTETTSDTQTSN